MEKLPTEAIHIKAKEKEKRKRKARLAGVIATEKLSS